MKERRLALGIDLSTQSLSVVVLDIDSALKVYEDSLDYVKDPRLGGFGIESTDYILPPRTEGEADQPPQMFFASLDAMFSDMKDAGVTLKDIVVINNSGQQHSHVYLSHQAQPIFAGLREEDSANSDLITLLEGCLAYGSAPIWMTSNTTEQAEFVRTGVGGKEQMIKLSGSDAPLRFTGAVMRRVAQQFPESYRQTDNIQLISSLVPAILTGNSKVPLDYGNGSGMSLMDYTHKRWSDLLIKATSTGLPGGEQAFRDKLPDIVAPYEVVGTIASYFVRKYGFSPACKIVAGSGDNPQSKVLVSGDLLSLGTSFVNMVSTDGRTLDMNGFANAMYDGVGRPFMFGCRTNGAMVWDRLRAMYGMKKEDYGPAEDALQEAHIAEHLVFWQPRNESFPPFGSFELVRLGREIADFVADYAGLVEASLASVYYHSRNFMGKTPQPLYVTGGATGSREIMKRVSAIWNRPVIPVEKGGAALGAAVAGAHALFRSQKQEIDVEQFSAVLLRRGEAIHPRQEDVSAVHQPGGYLDRFAAEEAKLLAAYPLNSD
jgi:xylulokinase